MLRYNRVAVFQINDSGGLARLICVRGATFAEGVRFEQLLHGSSLAVTFLGRFETVETVTGAKAFLDSCLAAGRQVGFAQGGRS